MTYNDLNFKQERMTTEEAANYIGLSKKTLCMWRVQGKPIKFIKLGNRVFYRKSDLDEFIEQNSGFVSTAQARLGK